MATSKLDEKQASWKRPDPRATAVRREGLVPAWPVEHPEQNRKPNTVSMDIMDLGSLSNSRRVFSPSEIGNWPRGIGSDWLTVASSDA